MRALQLRSVGLFAALFLLQVSAAFGHATVLSTEPPDGAVLAEPPASIVVRFNEPVSLIAAHVLDGAGAEVAQPEPAAVHEMEVRIALPAGLADGAYVASYRVVSLDSHPVGGSIVFTVGQASEGLVPVPSTRDAGESGWRAALVGLLAVFYAGALGSAGAVLFLLLVRPPEAAAESCARIAIAFSFLAIPAATFLIGVEGGLLLEAPPGALFSAEPWRIGFASTLGRSALAAIAGAALIAAALLRRISVGGRTLAGLGALMLLTSFVLTGHVATAAPRLFTVPLLLLHTAGIAFWIGSLLPLVRALARMGAEAAGIVRRFSQIALWSVAAIVASGVSIAALQLGGFAALSTCRYGQVLLLKLALVAALLILAAVNMLRLTPRIEARVPGAAKALQTSIAVEVGLAVLILITTAVLGTTPPPRAFPHADGSIPATMDEAHRHIEPAGPVLMVHAAGYMAVLRFDSAAAGANAVAIALSDMDGAPVAVREVGFSARNSAAGVEPISRAAVPAADGLWRVERILLLPAGTWSIRVDALVSDFEKATFEATIVLH